MEVVPNEIEEGFQVRVAPVLGLLLSSFGYFVQKGQDLL